ncbi:MAG: hypothetical protein J2P25_24450, partial [Nocardiopsaceae bacterium]|nr:hypothetical protein [Nocardiopsaceae bacterium]
AAPALSWHPGAAVTVVLAAEGYPGNPVKGDTILYPERIEASVLHAGTALRAVPATSHANERHVATAIAVATAHSSGAGRLVSAGGRVLNALGSGPDLAGARAAAYETIAQVEMRGGWYRHDIAERAAAGVS